MTKRKKNKTKTVKAPAVAKKDILTSKQEYFCQLFVSDDREFFGNGTQAYLEAYGLDPNKPSNYSTARVNASKLLTNTNILKRINELFETTGLNDIFVDKQLVKLITQDADYSTKMKAIHEYNLMKRRISNSDISVPDSVESITISFGKSNKTINREGKNGS